MMRQFQSASGRSWSAETFELEHLASAPTSSPTEVLRFMSPGLVCDLRNPPADWDKLPEPRLLELLDKALTEWVSSGRS